ncbi:hypothetical protein GCU60_07700 [Blastococcus saxobsidens]|uniref:DUF5642 domain-containing protein n=1 Tax=Blastococcus saxobsidens TaxID=138336 RepID=A0A6L9W0Z1_9ACTN|nr:hypothetical protein [Blastococcus saxobsidens]NEK85645.1 hypothetical protein [Blastococcus saxobsidens]
MTSSQRRRLPRLGAGLATALVLVGCGGGDSEEAASSSAATSSAEESSAEEPASDLAQGLLPAEAFGPDATVTAVSPDQLELGAGVVAGQDVQVEPESCRASVESTQPDLTEFDDVAAQSASAGSVATVEMLLRGGPTDDVAALLREAAERCPQATITSPQFGEATLTFENLPVDELGDGAALARLTTAVAAPDGSQVSVPTLIGMVEDDDRLLVLVTVVVDPTAGEGAGTDPAEFAALLEQAYETQADALG